jgi:acetyltransferase
LNTQEGSFLVLVSDQYQHQGVGSVLMQTVLDVARGEQLTQIEAEILAENEPMIELVKRAGAAFSPLDGTERVRATLTL